ncbi:MAG TPA: heavy metal translocating P-type ATPase, partial [Candidatus Sulfotelmatobacter sp.]|nr:heavy metal translocating P-type ATPase [Candidatus Sulfotelmatobacter sp.]
GLGEYLAGAVIAVMSASGRALETFARGRAERELAGLVSRAPTVAHRYEEAGIRARPVVAIQRDDRLLIRPGEVVPVDGVVLDVAVTLDESALTGESRLVVRAFGDPVASGTINAGAAFDLRATATADASTYAGIVRLVREAQGSRAPLVRLADRYALAFLPLTLGLAGIAWLASGDAVRALAVLVVATPCPLIIAAPIALVAGVSHAARRGIVVKGGGPLETLAGVRTLLMDKTGTLTAGSPRLERVEVGPAGHPELVLGLAASLEQASPHVLAAAIVHAAHDRGIPLEPPKGVTEAFGDGVSGTVGGHAVTVGGADLATAGLTVPRWAREAQRQIELASSSAAYVRVDDQLAGILVLVDPIRPEAPRALRLARGAGVRRIVLLSGDDPSVASAVGTALNIDSILAERTPAEKVAVVQAERTAAPGATVMIGDGINDAPALAAADCGVAMGARGATASSEAADVVITVDRLDRLAEAIRIAQRARRIALQSIVVGMALSLAAMVVAAAGFLAPVPGALLQEGIDVIVILNALRALGGERPTVRSVAGWAATRQRLEADHADMRPLIDQVRTAADRLGDSDRAAVPGLLRDLRQALETDLLPHELEEETTVYPLLARALGGVDPLAPLSTTHREIFHLARLFGRAVDGLPAAGPDLGQLPELRRVLYGLHAILELHLAQETELYMTLADPGAPAA